jgi:hypothetical protein
MSNSSAMVCLTWGAHAPSRVPARALAGRSGMNEDPIILIRLEAFVFREGAEHSTRGACTPHYETHL